MAAGWAVAWLLNGAAQGSEAFVGSGGMLLVTGAELKAGGEKLSAQELSALVHAGTSIVRVTDGGFKQRWTNGEDGTFIARTTSGAAYGYGSFNDTTGPGKWAVHNGEYCARINWTHKLVNILGSEQWCQAIYRMDGKLFLAPTSITPAQESYKFGEILFSN